MRTSPSINRLVDRLEEHSCLERRVLPEYRHAFAITMTKSGQRAFAEAERTAGRLRRGLVKQLSVEGAYQLRDLLSFAWISQKPRTLPGDGG